MARGQIFLASTIVLVLLFMGYKRMAIADVAGKQPIPAAKFDEPLASPFRDRESRLRRRLLLGHPIRLPARQGRHLHRSRIRRRLRQHRHLRPGHHRDHRPRRVRRDHLRPRQDHLRNPPPHLLLRRPRPHPAQPPGSRTKAPATAPPSSTPRKSSTRSPPNISSSLTPSTSITARSLPRSLHLKGFYKAEDYHQDYATKNPNNPYIQICDVPKISGLKAQFPELFQTYKGH